MKLHLFSFPLFLFFSFPLFAAAVSQVRVAHLAYNIETISVYLSNDTLNFESVSYGTITSYGFIDAGYYNVSIFDSVNQTLLFDKDIHVIDNGVYTIFVVLDNNNIQTVLEEDDDNAPADQYTAKLQIFQGVYETIPADILSNGKVIATLNFMDYVSISLPNGTYNISFQLQGAPSSIYSFPINIVGGQVQTIAFSGPLTNVNASTALDISYSYNSLRVVHLNVGGPNVDVFVIDGGSRIQIASDLAFKKITGYTLVPYVASTNYTIYVFGANSNTSISSLAIQPISDNVMTISLIGKSELGIEILPIVDNNSPPQDSLSNSVRFFHAAPGVPSLSLSLNGQSLFTEVNYTSVTEYKPVSTGTYNVSVLSGSNLIDFFTFEFVGGAVYTIFAEENGTISISTDASFTYFDLRIAHAAPIGTAEFILRDIHGIEVYSFGMVSYGNFTDYKRNLVVQNLTLDVPLGENSFTQSFNFQTMSISTLTLFGDLASNLSAVPFTDDNSAPQTSSNARIRFINAILGLSSPVDVKFEQVDKFTGVSYKQATEYIQVNVGTYNVTILSSGFPLLAFTQTFDSGDVYTMIAEGIFYPNSTSPVRAVVSVDQSYQYFNLRITHASSNAGNVDLLLDDGITTITAFSNVQYQQSVGYTEFVWSNYTLKVTPAGKKNDVVLEINYSLNPNDYYTINLVGQFNNTESPLLAKIWIDENSAPVDSNTAKFRFLHAVVGAPPVDILFNDKKIFGNIPYLGFVDYTNVMASLYRIDVYEANTTNHLQVLNNYKVVGGQDITLVVMGTVDNIAIQAYVYNQFTYFQLRFAHTSPNAGVVNVSLDGDLIWTLSYGNITDFREFTSDKQNLEVTLSNNVPIIYNSPFTVGAGSTAFFVGLKDSQSADLSIIVDAEKATVPSSNDVASIRVIQTSPNSPQVNIKLNDTVEFSVTYKQITDYKEIPEGSYTLDIATNHSILSQEVKFIGGFAYTILIEGDIASLQIQQITDYIPPSTGYIRFFQASPNTPAVDLLVDGSADFRNIAFESASSYNAYMEGTHSLRVVPTDLTVPTIISGEVVVTKGSWQSILLIGLHNQTENETSSLETWIISDDHILPSTGDILVRFIHASPNAPALDIRANGVSIFSGVTYKNLTSYQTLNADVYTVELHETGKTDVLLSSSLDLRVSNGSAIYTLVAEGLYGENLKILAFLDNGSAPPPDHTSTGNKGLSPVAIGLIVVGVILAVIALSALGFILWKRKRRAGYSEIASQE